MKRSASGFALLLILGVLAILSAIALSLAAETREGTRLAASDLDALQAERLVKSGFEVAAYLETRGVGSEAEDIEGLPAEVVSPAFRYRINFPTGAVDLFLESENGKLNATSTPSPILERFLSNWRDDATAGARFKDEIADWADPDDVSRSGGNESSLYLPLRYSPRNIGIGVADLPLVRGFEPADFRSSVRPLGQRLEVRYPLTFYFTQAPTGTAINPNFASQEVLESLPGLVASEVVAIIEARRSFVFRSAEQLGTLTGIAPNSPVWRYVTFGRGTVPAVFAVAKLRSKSVVRSGRRVWQMWTSVSPQSGSFETSVFLSAVETDAFPAWLARSAIR